jgi:hypothetical protein
MMNYDIYVYKYISSIIFPALNYEYCHQYHASINVFRTNHDLFKIGHSNKGNTLLFCKILTFMIPQLKVDVCGLFHNQPCDDLFTKS